MPWLIRLRYYLCIKEKNPEIYIYNDIGESIVLVSHVNYGKCSKIDFLMGRTMNKIGSISWVKFQKYKTQIYKLSCRIKVNRSALKNTVPIKYLLVYLKVIRKDLYIFTSLFYLLAKKSGWGKKRV